MSRRTLLSGMILGSILLAALTLVGVLIAAPSPRPPAIAQAMDTDTRTATQPELEAALLGQNDLPLDFQPDPAPKKRKPRLVEKCAALLDPAALVRSTTPQTTASSTYTGPALQKVNQVLAGFNDDQAQKAFYQLREVTRGCRDFSAKLADGTAVRVKVENLAAERPSTALLQVGGQSHAVRLIITSPNKTMTSYLAFGRVGTLVSVLSELDPRRQTTLSDFTGLVDTAARRLLVTGAR